MLQLQYVLQRNAEKQRHNSQGFCGVHQTFEARPDKTETNGGETAYDGEYQSQNVTQDTGLLAFCFSLLSNGGK